MDNPKPTGRERCSAFIIKGGKILLIKRIKPDRTYWVFPGGGRKPGESREDCIKREVYEELGLKARNCAHAVSFRNSVSGRKETCFLVDVEDGEPHITGEEKDRDTADNRYILKFEDPKILNQDVVFPPLAREWLKGYLEKNQT